MAACTWDSTARTWAWGRAMALRLPRNMSSEVEETASSQTTRWVVRYSCPFS
jgi:hypothetical protein